jgi:hypothetical protein
MYRVYLCLGTLTTLIFAAQSIALANTGAGNQAAQEESSASANGMQNSRARLSHDVSLLLYDTSQARTALQDNQRATASQDVTKALQADNQITSHHLVPLFSELDEYSVIGPIAASRSAARNTPETNQTPANQTRPEALAVRNVTGQYTMAELDPSLARTHLQAAQQALSSGNVQLAREALKGVEDSVILVSVGSDLPLVRARDNLVLARMDARHGQYEKAHLDLEAARRALSSYAKGGGAYASQADTLRTQIQNYNRNIQSNHAQAATNIESWWNQTAGWMTTPSTGTVAGS